MKELLYKFQNYYGQILFVLLVVSSALIGRYALWPLGELAVDRLAAELKTHRYIRELKANASLPDSLQIFKEALKRSEHYIHAVPSDSRGSFVLEKILENARESGLEISDINALDEIPRKGFIEFPFNLRVTGRFHQVQKLMAALENSPVVFGVRNLKLKTPSIHQPELTASLEVSAYALR